MSTSCETCGHLVIKKPWSQLLQNLEESSLEGCHGCTILCQAANTALRAWHEPYCSDPFLREAIELQWSLSSSRKIFILDVVKIEPEGPGTLLLKLQLHTSSGSASKFDTIGSAGIVARDSSSEECVDKIKDWLQKCRSDHRKCNSIKTEWSQRVPIPAKRVIDVGDDTRPPRLVEQKVIRAYYGCLSHCWGTSSPLTTTKATLAQRLDAIALGELPRTFRDAIMLTRALGLRYIWIDSLCIVQDDAKEWKQEASRMFEIYGHAFLTIAATAAVDSTKGLFGQRETSLPLPGTDVFVRKKIDHSVFRMPVLSTKSDVPGHAQASIYPLFTRGWCLQERLLSNRILHFTATEMVWQCRSCDICECDGIQLMDNIRSSRLLTSRLKYNRVIEGGAGSDIWTIWREIIEDYCSTNLTKDSDLLPALSGVAAKFGLAGAGTYIAGLWHKPGALSLGSSPLFLDLLWKSNDAFARRPLTKVAPSFSWASRLGPIQYRNEARDGPAFRFLSEARDGKRKHIHKCIFVVQLVEAYDNLDRYAPAPNSSLEIRTQLLPCVVDLDEEVSKIVLDNDERYEFTPDVANAVREEADAAIFIMPVAAYESFKTEATVFDGLVLAKVESDSYRRIGQVEGILNKWLRVEEHNSIILL